MTERGGFRNQQAHLDWVKFMRRLVEVFLKQLQIIADILKPIWKPIVYIAKLQCETTILKEALII